MGSVLDMKVRGQLACPEIKKKKKKSCELYIYIYIFPLYILYCTLMMYKTVKTSISEGRVVRVKYESLEQTTCYWVGQNK